MTTEEMVRESNRIEGIRRDPTPQEIAEHERFVGLPSLSIPDLEHFLSVYQPDARLRNRAGMNVHVRTYFPPTGGPGVVRILNNILDCAAHGIMSAFRVHVEFENLHPFTDGNGRVGRAIWYWMMREHPIADLGFLHAFYYQALERGL